jgi:hypothetical protein
MQSAETGSGRLAGFYPLRIRYRGVDRLVTRRLLGPGQIFVNGRGVAFGGRWPGPADFVDIQVPNPPAIHIRFANPRVLVTGPWNLRFRRLG